jgi:hypothetical protein
MVRHCRFVWTEYVDRAEETDKVPFAFLLAAHVRLTSLTAEAKAR